MKKTILLLQLLIISILWAPDLLASTSGLSSGAIVYGCTNPRAVNFNPLATVDNGTCVFDSTHNTTPQHPAVIYGCMNPKALNYNKYATVDNRSCVFDSAHLNTTTGFRPDSLRNKMLYGCKDSTALNYNPLALYDNHNCRYTKIIPGCMDTLAFNYNKRANVDDGSCKYERPVWGCTDSAALNFNPKANHDNGRCRYTAEIPGCTDKNAINYNPNATKNNRTCIFLSNDSIPGCTDPYALNFNKYAKKDNGSCRYVTITDSIRGCMDSLALNFNPIATKAGRCYYSQDSVVFGCKSPRALNFNKLAKIDDGSCVFAFPDNTLFSKLTPEITAITDTLSKVLQAACNFDYNVPIDTVYIVNVKPLGNKKHEVEWAIVQGTVTTNVKTVFSIEKQGTNVLYLSLVCTQNTSAPSDGMSKISAATTVNVSAATVSAFFINKVISGVSTTSTNVTGISFYPNPVSDLLNISCSNSTNDKLEFTIYSVDGRKIMNEIVNSANGTNNFVMNTAGLSSGLHFLTINRNGTIIETLKFEKR